MANYQTILSWPFQKGSSVVSIIIFIFVLVGFWSYIIDFCGSTNKSWKNYYIPSGIAKLVAASTATREVASVNVKFTVVFGSPFPWFGWWSVIYFFCCVNCSTRIIHFGWFGSSTFQPTLRMIKMVENNEQRTLQLFPAIFNLIRNSFARLLLGFLNVLHWEFFNHLVVRVNCFSGLTKLLCKLSFISLSLFFPF